MAPAPKKPKLTHFLLLPLATSTSRPQLQSSLHRFATDVTTPKDNNDSSNEEPTFPIKAIRPVGAIHFTIGVMSLLTPEQVEAACNFLRGLDVRSMLSAAAVAAAISTNQLNPTSPSSSPAPLAPPQATTTSPNDQPSSLPPQPPPLHLSLTGLHSLRPPTRTSSLHASPSSSSSPHLHPFALALRTAFTSAGFLVEEPRPLVLHATVLNTIYAREKKGGTRKGQKGGKGWWGGKFDARYLIERYENMVWMEGIRIEKVAICEMGAKDVVEEEEGARVGNEEGRRVVQQEYKEIASVDLPS
ncbi:kinase A anchor protein [Usnea florida]